MTPQIKTIEDWLASPKVAAELKEQLRDLQALSQAGDSQAQEILTDSFSQELEFGTSGLRGILGPGNNRMNVHTVAKATQGLSAYILKHYPESKPAVCIAYDSRHMSQCFAETAAKVLCANGIRAWLYQSIRPTPMLSYAIRALKASAGIVITASHNPREYNGYKVYGHYGAQISGQTAVEILDYIGACDLFELPQLIELEAAKAAGLFQWIPAQVERSYYDKVKLLVQQKAMLAQQAANLHILYTPLYGTGAYPVSLVLEELGFRLDYVEEQMQPDGDFPTTPYPNPEKLTIYTIAREIATKNFPDLIFATDPDCDRIGLMVRDQRGEYQLLNGNQIGLLLCDYLLENKKARARLNLRANINKKKSLLGTVYSTIVSTDLLASLCNSNGAEYIETLPGFKYIAEKVEALEQAKPGSFIFGMEESNGYLAGNFVRDKDGVIGAVLLAELGIYYKKQGRSLLDALEDIYQTYGYSLEETLFYAMPGQQGQQGQRKIRQLINEMRQSSLDMGSPASQLTDQEGGQAKAEDQIAKQRRQVLEQIGVNSVKDYLLGIDNLPSANVLKFYCYDGSWLAMRPSGTEAKLKIYLSAKGGDRKAAQQRLAALRQAAAEMVGAEIVLADDQVEMEG